MNQMTIGFIHWNESYLIRLVAKAASVGMQALMHKTCRYSATTLWNKTPLHIWCRK